MLPPVLAGCAGYLLTVPVSRPSLEAAAEALVLVAAPADPRGRLSGALVEPGFPVVLHGLVVVVGVAGQRRPALGTEVARRRDHAGTPSRALAALAPVAGHRGTGLPCRQLNRILTLGRYVIRSLAWLLSPFRPLSQSAT